MRAITLLLLVSTTNACVIDHDVPVSLVLPDTEDVVYVELRVYAETECPSTFDEIVTGEFDHEPLHQDVFALDETGFAVGALEPRTYIFVGISLTEACEALHYGCDEVYIGEADRVRLELTPYQHAPLWTCVGDQICLEGLCD